MEKLYSESDWQQVTEQLGRSPRGFYKVTKYHPQKKHPMVIQVIPWVEKAPFPTMYWLTCPILKKQLSHLEKDRLIKVIESDHLAQKPELLESLRSDHKNYRDERIELFNKTVKNWDELPEAQRKIIEETGIGGMADFDHVKCLHLHYAYHLALEGTGGGTIGNLVDELFPIIKSHY